MRIFGWPFRYNNLQSGFSLWFPMKVAILKFPITRANVCVNCVKCIYNGVTLSRLNAQNGEDNAGTFVRDSMEELVRSR